MVFSTKVRWFGRKSGFRYPLGDSPRTALLTDWFNASIFPFHDKESVRFFASHAEAAQFAPAAVAGTGEQLLNIDPSAFPPLSHAVIALSRPGERLLTAAEREWLWRSFQVPVFEQIVGLRGKLLASECEAHDGLHVQTSDWSPGAAYSLDYAVCPCGLTLPRLSSPKCLHLTALAG